MKTHDHDNAHAAQRRAVAQQAEQGEAAAQLAQAGSAIFDHRVNHSPRLVAQRQRLDAAFGPVAQREPQVPEEELPVQGKSITLQQPVQREAGLGDEEPAVAGSGSGGTIQAQTEVPAEANLTGMPNQLKSGVEALSGMDMSDVRVHRNSDKPAQLNALAYAQGNEIHPGPGQEQHLPHEAWHVVQQRQGRVQATMQMVGVNDDVVLEEEADVMRAAAQLAREGKKQALTPYAQSIFGPWSAQDSPAPAAGVLQGYFEVDGQRTDDDTQFVMGLPLPAKKAQVWLTLRPAVATSWKALPGHHFNDAILEEASAGLLNAAFAPATKTALAAAARALEGEWLRREQVRLDRIEALVPLGDRDSPATVGGTLGRTPTLASNDKHSPATYRRTTTDPLTAETTVGEEFFVSDAYTKGPSRRKRDGEPVTTPTGVQQTWTKVQVMNSVRAWPCEAPLARHLSLTIWPLLTNSAEGRLWEVKFREMDRLVAFRDSEAQSQSFTIWRRAAPKAQVKALDRNDFTVRARQALKAAILADTKHPAAQQGVLFYDALLKADVDAAFQDVASTTFDVNAAYEVPAPGLSMTLTHWRPILFFDWILAEDVLNNAA